MLVNDDSNQSALFVKIITINRILLVTLVILVIGGHVPMNAISEFGLMLIQILQSMSPAFDGPMNVVSFLGTIEFYLILVPLLYWTVNTRLGLRVLLILISADFVGTFLKLLLHQPRPYWVSDKVKSMATDTTYSLPSNHANDSLAVWGYLAYHVRQRWFWIAATVIVFLIGVSRVYLGVHFPHDVIVGWVVGGVVLILFITGEQRLSPWLSAQSAGTLIGMGFGLSVAIVLMGLLAGAVIAGSPDPVAWASFAAEARSPAGFFTLGGSLFGAVAGFVLMQQYARFRTDGPWMQRSGRFLLGMVGVLICWQGLSILFGLITTDETAMGYILRYIRYALTTGWAMFGAPWVFLRVKLAERG